MAQNSNAQPKHFTLLGVTVAYPDKGKGGPPPLKQAGSSWGAYLGHKEILLPVLRCGPVDGGGCAQNEKIPLTSGAALMNCRYCQQQFQPFLFRPQQTVCSQRDCQRRRRTDYHRLKVQSDSEYAQVVRDSRKKWRDAHPDYQKNYWQTHDEAARRNRQRQRQRDQKRRVQKLVKNTLALDLKRSPAQVWLVGPAAQILVKNNLASSNLFIFQPLELGPASGRGS